MEEQRPLERRERELVDPQRALERVPAQPFDEVGAAEHDPGLRAAEQLVAGEADEIGAGRERLACGGLGLHRGDRAGAEVVHEREPVAPCNRGHLLEPRPLLEADDTEVRLVDAQQDRRLWPDRAFVVGRPRPVRRPDLDEPGAGAREHVGDPEAVADLDQLASRDHDLAALRERGECEQDRRGVVVDDERSLAAGQPVEDLRDVILARASGALVKVVLEVRVAASGLNHPLERLLGERRAAEVRVDDDTCRVEHAPQARTSRIGQFVAQPRRQISRIGTASDLLARSVDDGPGSVDRERVAGLAGELVHRRQVAELHGSERYCASAFSGA